MSIIKRAYMKGYDAAKRKAKKDNESNEKGGNTQFTREELLTIFSVCAVAIRRVDDNKEKLKLANLAIKAISEV